MKVATIVPVPYLYHVMGQSYHLCLSHVVSESEDYKEFYKQQAANGHFVVIDNGAAEGACQPIEKVLANALAIGAHELVLPDDIYDQKNTLQMLQHSYNYIWKDWKGQIMVVPQGETFKEWCDCTEQMFEWPVHCIGISKFITPKYKDECRGKARLEAYKFVEELARGQEMDVHLLGCWDHPVEIAEIYSYACNSTVQSEVGLRGTDSAIAYVYAADNKALLPAIPRPDLEVDFLNGNGAVDGYLLDANIRKWQLYCTGAL